MLSSLIHKISSLIHKISTHPRIPLASRAERSNRTLGACPRLGGQGEGGEEAVVVIERGEEAAVVIERGEEAVVVIGQRACRWGSGPGA